MKKRLIITIIFLLISFSYGKKVNIKLATLAGNGSPWDLRLREMGQNWKDESDGDVRLTIYPGGVAGDESSVIRKMRIGQLNAASISTEGLSKIVPDFAAISHIPLLYNSDEEKDYVTKKMSPDLISQLDKKGYKFIHWGEIGWVRYFAKSPVLIPDDLKKHKMFVWANESQDLQMHRELGFNPVPLAATDLTVALQTGMVTTFNTTPIVALGNQWFAAAKHMTNYKWAPLMGATIIKNETWSAIPTKIQDLILSASKKAEIDLTNEIRRLDDEIIDVMADYGLVSHDLNQDQIKKWEEFVDLLYPYIRGKVVPTESFDKAIKFRDEFRLSN